MQKVNQIFGKEVINQVGGEKIATVHDVVMDRDTRYVTALLIRSGGFMGNTSVVRWSSVISIGDVVIIRAEKDLPSLDDDAEVSELAKQAHRITGTSIISAKGEHLGSVGDIFINERGEITGFEVKQGMLHSNRYLPVEHVQAVGKDAVIATIHELPDINSLSDEQAAPPEQTVPPEQTTPPEQTRTAEPAEAIFAVEPVEVSEPHTNDTERAS